MPVLHARTQIRRAVVTGLTGLATTGANVFPGRARPLGKDHDDCLLIYTTTTQTLPDATGGGGAQKMLHTLGLVIEGRISGSDAADLEERLDQVELEVATAMAGAIFAPLPVLYWVLTRSTMNAQAPGERHEGEVRLEYDIQFRTAEDAPGAIIP